MASRTHEVTVLASKTPGHLRGGWSHFEKKLGILPGVLYGKVVRAPHNQLATHLSEQYFPVETMSLPELLLLPASVYFANIGPRLGHSKQLCGRVRHILFDLNKNYLREKVWQETTLEKFVQLLQTHSRIALRFGPYAGTKSIDAFYECLNARQLLPPRCSGK